MKDKRSSPRRRAILVLFKAGFTPAHIGRLLKLKVGDVMTVVRSAL